MLRESGSLEELRMDRLSKHELNDPGFFQKLTKELWEARGEEKAETPSYTTKPQSEFDLRQNSSRDARIQEYYRTTKSGFVGNQSNQAETAGNLYGAVPANEFRPQTATTGFFLNQSKAHSQSREQRARFSNSNSDNLNHISQNKFRQGEEGQSYPQIWQRREETRQRTDRQQYTSAGVNPKNAFFCVKQTATGDLQIVLHHVADKKIRKLPFVQRPCKKPAKMDWDQRFCSSMLEDITKYLDACLAAAEEGVDRLSVQNINLSWHKTDADKHQVDNNDNVDKEPKGYSTLGRTRNKGKLEAVDIPIDSQESTLTSKDRALSCDVLEDAEDCPARIMTSDPDKLTEISQNLHRTSGMYCLAELETTLDEDVFKQAEENQPHMDSGEPSGVHENSQEASARHRKSDGQLVKDDSEHAKVTVPKSIIDVRQDLLSSGMAVYPETKDKNGASVLIVFCKHPCWESEEFDVNDFAKVLLYFWTLTRSEEGEEAKLTVIADSRGSTLQVLNALLETLYTVEASQKGAVSMVHVLADRVGQSLLFRSPVFRPQIQLKIDLVTSIDTLYKFVKAKQLPPELGGSRVLFHEEWVQFRQKLEPFVNKCQSVAQNLVSVMQKVASLQEAPETAEEAARLIEEHEMHIHSAVEDQRLSELQAEGQQTLEQLDVELNMLSYCAGCRREAENAKKLYKQVRHTVIELVRLADTRMHRLEQCLQLRQFEQASSQVIAWLCSEGKEILTKNEETAESLKGITAQQKAMEKQYFAAMSQIDKANDLLEEASMLTQSGHYDEVTGIREIARELKSRKKHFVERLEDIRLRIEDTYKCFHLMDKAYEWALNAMKYVAGMKMENTMTAAAVDKLLTSIEQYLHDHPAIPADTFDQMAELASKLHNHKLQDQCKVAKTRYLETHQLLHMRQSMLRRARTQLELEQQRRNSVVAMSSGAHYQGSPEGPKTANVLPPVMLRRRSFAGKASSPSYSTTAAAFMDNVRDVNLMNAQERLFQEGLITEDMSDRIVASLPKGLADPTLRGSRESLRGSRESLQGSFENLLREQKSSSVPKEMPGSSAPVAVPMRSHHRRHMHRVASLQIDSRGEVVDSGARHDRSNLKSLSMITGSTESLLASMPEEEDQADRVVAMSAGRKCVWSPVPVNTHLMSQNARGLSSYASMADLRETEQEVKKRRTLMMIMSEMIHTERDYVKSLQFVIDNYIPEIMREDVPQALRGKRSTVFGNLEQIHTFHSGYFLAEIQQCENNPYQICHCFLQHENEFYLYALYNKNKPKSDSLMEEYGRAFFKKKQSELGDSLDLSSYLLKPVQRMGKYALLLRQIIKECPESDPDYSQLHEALEMVRFQLRHGNDLLAMDSLRDCDVSIAEQGQLIRQEEFLVWQGRKKCMRHVFLFEEMVLFSKTRRTPSGHDVYVYKSSLKTSDLGMTENIGSSGYKFELWFRRRKMGDTYVLQAKSTDSKKAWVSDISRLLWKQAIKNREIRFSEMAKMGIGNKPCLDLKASDDNIHDRFVNLGNRAPRSRSSVAVSTFDHLKDGAKRPHSIISVSSSSSSNSSSSKSSGYGTCDSSLDDSRTSKGISRSYAVSSVESGIGSDLSPDGSTPVHDRRGRFGLDKQSPCGSTPASPSSPMSLVHEVISESDV